MKTRPVSRLFALFSIGLLSMAATLFADTYTGKVSDLDAADGRLTVTSEVDESSKEFKVSTDTVIVDADGKPSQLLNLVETTRVQVEADPGPANIATKITVLPDAGQQVP
ncbi:MAG TPA: hypothetical protein PLS03_04045 [Terrimicrobiaceae bacterium]|nr:hypothetical protein [Terrimicrobiaceae bacterium]